MQAPAFHKVKGSAVLITLALAQFASAQFLVSAYSSSSLLYAVEQAYLTAPSPSNPIAVLVHRLASRRRKA